MSGEDLVLEKAEQESEVSLIERDLAAAADELFSKLAELAGRYAPAAGRIDRSLLSRDLSGTPLGRAPSMGPAWELLDRLAARLRDRTGFDLSDPTGRLEVDRMAARQQLATEMTAVGTGGTLLVHGEPDVGKSALTLRAAEEFEAAGGVVTIVSIRDLPPTTVELEALLGGGVEEILSATATAPARLLVLDGAEAVLEGRGSILLDLTTAALRAGIGVVAVSRRDGATAVAEALRHASEAADLPDPVRRHEVMGLTTEDAGEVVATFGSLTRLSEEPRAAWLLARPKPGVAGPIPAEGTSNVLRRREDPIEQLAGAAQAPGRLQMARLTLTPAHTLTIVPRRDTYSSSHPEHGPGSRARPGLSGEGSDAKGAATPGRVMS